MGDIFYNKTVTIYNKYVDDDGTSHWIASVLKQVRLLINKGANVAATGIADANAAVLHIRTNDLSKQYLKPLEWQKEENREAYFTLTSGADFFVEGDTSSEKILESEFFEYMKQTYDNCFMINNVDRYELIPHFEIGGK